MDYDITDEISVEAQEQIAKYLKIVTFDDLI
jgi:hypothetical protein